MLEITSTDEYAIEEGTIAFDIALTDTDGSAITPDSIVWSLIDTDGNIINSKNEVSVSVPQETNTIVLSGDDLALSTAESENELSHVRRILVVEAVADTTLGDNLPFKQQIRFPIEKLNKTPA